MTKPSVSVFFPCYNDANTIGKLVTEVNSILQKRASRYEIIVVNDGSKDNSLEVLKKIKLKVKKLKIINHLNNLGYGATLKTGFRSSKYDLVFYTDGDGQYDVSELPILLSCLTKDIDIVNGIKIDRQDNSIRIILGNAYKSIVRNVFDLPIYDVDCDYRLIRKNVLQKIKLTSNSGAVCVELVSKLKSNDARFREVSVHHYPRKFGHSEFFRLKPILLTTWDLVFLRMNKLFV